MEGSNRTSPHVGWIRIRRRLAHGIKTKQPHVKYDDGAFLLIISREAYIPEQEKHPRVTRPASLFGSLALG